MDDVHEHSVESAREAAGRDDLDKWVRAFLASPGSDNAELAEQLTDETRWWTGPLELPLDQLNRLAGPPGAPVIEEIHEDEWRDDVDDLARKIEAGFEPPPVVAIYRNDQLVLEDGNHRVEALRRAGRTEAWGVVGFEDAAARDAFEPPTA
jgi:hypothetical protein